MLSFQGPPWAILESQRDPMSASSEARATLSVVPRDFSHLSGLLEIQEQVKCWSADRREGVPPIEVNPPSLKLESGIPKAQSA